MKRISLAGLALALTLTACTSWEHSTYQALAAAQTTINSAQAAYEVSAGAPCPAPPATPCIPHTAAAYKIINDAKDIDKTAVDAMITYEEIKAANAASPQLQKAQADVEAALQQLPTIIADVKALYAIGGGN